MQDIAGDSNIRNIAQYLLQQEYATMRADSQVIQIERDFPYYKFVFLSGERNYITIIVLYDLVRTNVQVMSVTSRQQSQQSIQYQQNTTSGGSLTAAQQVITSSSSTQGQSTQGQTTQSQTTQNTQGQSLAQQTVSGLVQVPKINNTQTSIQATQTSPTILQPTTTQTTSQMQTNNQQNTQVSKQSSQPSNLIPATKTETISASSPTLTTTVISSDINLVKANKVESTTASQTSTQSSSQGSKGVTSTSSSAPSSVDANLVGFQVLSPDSALYSYAAGGMKKVS